MAFENRLPAFERPGSDSHGSPPLRLAGGWQVRGLQSRLAVCRLAAEPAPFAQHPTLLVVAKGYSVTGPLGGVFLPGHPGCPHRLRQEWVVFLEGKMSKLAEGKLARLPH
jgi:hypothetical protein